MHIAYDPEHDTAYVRLTAHVPPGGAVRQVPVDGPWTDAEAVLDLDADGRLLGIEVTGARRALPAHLLDAAERETG
ncbi:DUF2283 domain-containing protein [Streptomyces sp. NPDC101219]|uniref:DUF2283 domain-containing protein n=1 Tax=Streptomyces sp. NPDC101219 TaxID=3366131 RepID=UPI0037FA7D45